MTEINRLSFFSCLAVAVLATGCLRAGSVVSDSPSSQQVSALLSNEIQWLLTNAPYKQYDTSTSTYNSTFGRTSGAACESIRALYEYYTRVNSDPNVYSKIVSLAQWASSNQDANSSDIQFGGFPSQPDSSTGKNYYYSIDAAFCLKAMLDTYQLTGNSSYKTAAINAATFLRSMQNANSLPFPFANNIVWNSSNNPVYLGGFCEYYRSDTNSISNSMYTKLLLAVPYLTDLYNVTGNTLYQTMASDARSFLVTGLTNTNEYFQPNSFWGGSYSWHRVSDGVSEKYVYDDSVGYAIRGLYLYEGFSSDVQNAYQTYNGYTYSGYQPDFAWAGYLYPASLTISGSPPYYDLISAGLLLPLRKDQYPNAYTTSRNTLLQNANAAMYWGIDLNMGMTITTSQDASAISNLAEALVLTNPYQ